MPKVVRCDVAGSSWSWSSGAPGGLTSTSKGLLLGLVRCWVVQFKIFFKENTSGCCDEVVSHRATTTINSGIFVVFPLPVLFAAHFEVQVKCTILTKEWS